SMALTESVQLQRPDESVVLTKEQAVMEAARLGMPVAMKVIGPIHKTEVGGVVININSLEQVRNEFTKLMKINDAKAVLIQRMVKGIELFIGAKREGAFGHLILFGIGGIFIEVLKDFRAELTPISLEDAMGMIKKIKSYNILKGYRGMKGVNEMQLAYAIMKVSALLEIAPEIYELDINPLIATDNKTYAVDIRINIDK
ncbi:MAG: acetate--CoA ligase family protein, partial [Bacteroidales bacterium]|nr:acetate--CoA ligase family protein [Bacteroidales bacterium]